MRDSIATKKFRHSRVRKFKTVIGDKQDRRSKQAHLEDFGAKCTSNLLCSFVPKWDSSGISCKNVDDYKKVVMSGFGKWELKKVNPDCVSWMKWHRSLPKWQVMRAIVLFLASKTFRNKGQSVLVIARPIYSCLQYF